jgi:hypothetical protein
MRGRSSAGDFAAGFGQGLWPTAITSIACHGLRGGLGIPSVQNLSASLRQMAWGGEGFYRSSTIRRAASIWRISSRAR